MSSRHVRAYLREIGQKGGEARAKKLSSHALSAQARQAVVSRWMRNRFGADRFESLALPGWEIVDSGLKDLIHGRFETVNALAVAEVRPRLRFLGVPVPDVSNDISHAREKLFRTMEAEHGEMGNARFYALLERVDSFCDALASTMPVPKQAAHRNRRWCA